MGMRDKVHSVNFPFARNNDCRLRVRTASCPLSGRWNRSPVSSTDTNMKLIPHILLLGVGRRGELSFGAYAVGSITRLSSSALG